MHQYFLKARMLAESCAPRIYQLSFKGTETDKFAEYANYYIAYFASSSFTYFGSTKHALCKSP